MPLVTIRVLSDDPAPVPVEGMVVEFYDTDAVFQTSGVTDDAGEVTATLPDHDYDVVFFKVGHSILPRQPQRITVDSLLSNTFEVTSHARFLPESTNLLRCTVSGYILGVDGKEAKHRLVFEPCHTITILSNNVVAPYSRKEVSSDDEGYFEFELLRNTEYTSYFVEPEDLFGEQPGTLRVITPNAPAVTLDALLFPLPINFEFSETAISLTVGADPDTSIDTEIRFNDGSLRDTLSTPWARIALTNSDSLVVTAALMSGNKLCLTPVGSGVATITTVRYLGERTLIDPLPAYVTNSIVVTVT